MSGRVSSTVCQQWLDDFRSVWVGLHFSNPDVDDPVLSELSGGGYRRVPVELSPVSARSVLNLEPIRFTGLPSGLVTYVGVWSEELRGGLMASAPLAAPQRLIADSTYVISQESLAISIA